MVYQDVHVYLRLFNDCAKSYNKRKEELLEGSFTGKSSNAIDLEQHKDWEVDYIMAVPRIAHNINIVSRYIVSICDT